MCVCVCVCVYVSTVCCVFENLCFIFVYAFVLFYVCVGIGFMD